MKTVFLDFDSLRPADLNLDKLQQELASVDTWPVTERNEYQTRVADAEVVVVNKLRLDASAMDQSPRLKLICLAATGVDNVDVAAARERGIAISNIREYCTPSVVQHVFALLLALNQNLLRQREQISAGDWQKSAQFCLLDPPFRELHGQTLGLIGLGELGSGVAGVARSFGMRVIAARLPWRTAAAPGKSGQSVPRLPLEELFDQSDIVSLHCPLNDDTRHIIDAAALEQMKRDAFLINTARGGLVDSAALVNALQNKEIAGAGIDVLAEEPPTRGDPLLDVQLANLIITPHIAWGAREARQRALDEIIANINAFANGEERNRVC
ncbi:MAG: NAD(P)-dependent oxidoreductase [Gammaproteobacteria bacterium]|jgi:glycerate dehydrogenase|nr:glycerate dehydrogenase [Chromatiales bacterium]MDP6151393.1 NAD(P)-dependent oxidoreductase [Gammaproteobacteria bacterium]MDP7092803.1 NAD(P)-dependent oxidoreductase [Gammaproteobacteria bacterium]MDP7270090.1 NAD(P)-dependent oxidoreductase [Gammaproteobacteria bacterium]MDP7419481.1 NAD(P)-dependent oxidoreductase [Gammaproteobacteria bacterium]